MNYFTIDSKSISGRCHSKEDSNRIAQYLKSHFKDFNNLNSTCSINKKINCCNFEPENIPSVP